MTIKKNPGKTEEEYFKERKKNQKFYHQRQTTTEYDARNRSNQLYFDWNIYKNICKMEIKFHTKNGSGMIMQRTICF